MNDATRELSQMVREGRERIAELEQQLAAANQRADDALSVIRENGFGANSETLDDAVRQVLQVAITERDNRKDLERQLAAKDAEIAGLKATIKPLVKALTHAKTRLESVVRLIGEKPEPHSNLDAAHNAARRLAIEEVATLDATLAPYRAVGNRD